MLKTLTTVAAATALMTSAASHADTKSKLGVERFGIYIVSDDLDRSKSFYTDLFESAPEVEMPALIGYDVSGSLFAIVSREVYAKTAKTGTNTIPYIKVANIDAAFEHAASLPNLEMENEAPVHEGAFSFFRFTDPDANTLEFYAIQMP